MTLPTASVLCIRHHRIDDIEIARDVFQRHSLEIDYLDAWREPIPASARPHCALIVLGGTMNVDEAAKYPFLDAERKLLQQAVADNQDVLGVCLGAQLLAQISGGSVTRGPQPVCGFLPLRTAAGLAADRVLTPYESGDRILRWHAYTCEPAGHSEVLLWGEDNSIQGFRLGDRAWGIQFHPEISHEMLETWIDDAGPALERDWNTTGEELMRQSDRWLEGEQRKALAMFESFARTIASRRGEQANSRAQLD